MKITFDNLEEKYVKLLEYLEVSTNFRDHEDKPWIKEDTLARWLYEGSVYAVKEFKKDKENAIILESEYNKIQHMEENLDKWLNIFANKLLTHFPNDKLIQEAISQ